MGCLFVFLHYMECLHVIFVSLYGLFSPCITRVSVELICRLLNEHIFCWAYKEQEKFTISLIKILPRPIIKITNIAEIVPDKYPESAFLNSALKLPKATKTVVQICAQTLVNLIFQGVGARGCMGVMRKI